MTEVFKMMHKKRTSESRTLMVPTRPSPQDLPSCIRYACGQLMAPFNVKIMISEQGEIIFQKNPRRSRTLSRSQQSTMAAAAVSTAAATLVVSEVKQPADSPDHKSSRRGGQLVVFTLVKDSRDNYVEVLLNRCDDIPIMLLQVIGLCLPYHPLLQKITIRWGLTGRGLYEISKLLSTSQLTELCFDDSPVAARNYEVLLEKPSKLRMLSLARCSLDDDDCDKIMRLLSAPHPVVKLRVLILASNLITDTGAQNVARMLRANRTIRHLNLAGNQITDIGGISIIESLGEFLLTNNELEEKKKRYLEYLKKWNEMYVQCMRELMGASNRRVSTRKKSILREEGVRLRAQSLTTQRVGVFEEPFSGGKVVSRGAEHYCTGNLVLCSLNLSYNSLAQPSLSKIYNVLVHQSWHLTAAEPGLVRVCVEGNYMPEASDELRLINDMLGRAQQAKPKLPVPKRLRTTDKKGKVNEKFSRMLGA